MTNYPREHPQTRATAVGSPTPTGVCRWRWHWEDVDLRCEEPAIPGGDLCTDHLIEKTRKAST